MNILQKKFFACLMIIVFIAAVIPLTGTVINVAEAAVIANFTETTESKTLDTVNLIYGTITEGSSLSLVEKNGSYMSISSTSNGTDQEASFWSEVALNSADTYIYSLGIDIGTKSSVSNSSHKIYLYNYDTSAYELVKTDTVGTSDTDIAYLNESNSSIARYVSSSNLLKIKVVVTNTSSFTASFDYLNIIYEYQPQVSSRVVSTYNVDNATLEYGTISANDPTYLRHRDVSYFSVASSSDNKVAWSSRVTLNQMRSEIKTLIISYSGKYSTTCNNSWLSLWNFETTSWEVVYTFTSDTNTRNVRWLSSDPIFINKFVSEFNDVKIRLYNSAGTAFTRDSDYLNITVYYDTANNVKSYAPDTLALDYGTISSGTATDLVAYDNSAVVIDSDAYNRIAWKCQTTIDVDKQYVKSLTVMTRVKVNANTNSQYFSLWNNNTNNWVVFRTQTSSTSNENLIITITDPVWLDTYISSTGVIQARLYNSAAAAFTRTTDFLTFIIEYGTVGTFEFATVCDTHELIGQSNLQTIISELNNTNPAFTVFGGDLTDHGTPGQYDALLSDVATLNGTKYLIAGNHDVRWWNSNGKNDWETRVGPLYQSFDYGGVHFVLMDSSVVWQNDEKFNKVQLEWLANDLSTISTTTPVIIFAHHPFRTGDDVTGRQELLNLVKNYNVVAFLAGHEHTWSSSTENGVPWLIIDDVKYGTNYLKSVVTPNYLYLYKRNVGSDTTTLWQTLPMNNKRKASISITDVSVSPVDGDVTVSVTIDSAPDAVSTVEARIDNYGPWTTLTQNGNVWSGTIDTSAYAPAVPYGKHFIGVNMTDEAGNVWKEFKEYEWSGGNVSTKWVFQTGDVIQAAPTYFNGVVYVGSEDGKVYAINDIDGSLKWSYATGDQVISKPAIYQGVSKNLVLVGSHDKNLYALNADTGAVEWTYLTGGSVISDPLVDNGVVYFGSGDNYIYAVNANDGSLKWRYFAEGLMRKKPIVSNGILYAFVRNTYIWYAINANDGSLCWRGNANTDESMFVVGDINPVLAGNKLWCCDAQYTRLGYLNPATGSLDYVFDTLPRYTHRSMATDGIKVYVPLNSGKEIYAINVSDNSQAWYTDLRANASDTDIQPYTVDTALILSDGILYVVAERGRITGVDSLNGSIKFVYDAAGYPERVIWSAPEVNNKVIYMGGIDGKVYAVQYTGS